jgi:hypothetical protein
MMDDLPDLGNFFENINNEEKINVKKIPEQKTIDNEIYIYISKDGEKWISASFIDIAPGNIGLHIILPVAIEFQVTELDNVRLKFEKRLHDTNIVLKECQILVRWQERDTISGRMKIGVHFHGDLKNDKDIIGILDTLKQQKSAKS